MKKLFIILFFFIFWFGISFSVSAMQEAESNSKFIHKPSYILELKNILYENCYYNLL